MCANCGVKRREIAQVCCRTCFKTLPTDLRTRLLTEYRAEFGSPAWRAAMLDAIAWWEADHTTEQLPLFDGAS